MSPSWKEEVGRVFNTQPRIGHTKGTIWLERQEEQKLLEEAFDRPGIHVCIDGPTGTGKSSLALTHLIDKKCRHVAIQVSASMDWRAFCRQLITPPSTNEISFSAQVEGGESTLPVGEFRISLGGKGGVLPDSQLVESLSSFWTEHDVARNLTDERATLLVDDLERANGDLILRLSDLAKLMTQSFVEPKAKLLFVGTGDIYSRIYRANRSLEERLAEISLGAFRTPNDSWRFLTLGLDDLRIWHPGRSKIEQQRKGRDACIRTVYEAADCLPKSLNRLGQEIAFSAGQSKSATIAVIIKEANVMALRHWEQYYHEFPHILECLRKNDVAAEIVKHLYNEGMASIHDCRRISSALRGRHSRRGHVLCDDSIEQGINILVKEGFLVRTGISGEVLFPADPTSAHTLGAAMRQPKIFRGAIDILYGLEQMELPYFYNPQ